MLTIIKSDGSFRHEITHADGTSTVYEGDAGNATKTDFDAQGVETGAQNVALADVTAAVEAARAAETVPAVPPLTPLEFFRLFTMAEDGAIRTAAKTDVMVEAFLDRARVATAIELAHPDVAEGVAYLVAQSIITQARADAILAGNPPA